MVHTKEGAGSGSVLPSHDFVMELMPLSLQAFLAAREVLLPLHLVAYVLPLSKLTCRPHVHTSTCTPQIVLAWHPVFHLYVAAKHRQTFHA